MCTEGGKGKASQYMCFRKQGTSQSAPLGDGPDKGPSTLAYSMISNTTLSTDKPTREALITPQKTPSSRCKDIASIGREETGSAFFPLLPLQNIR
jgi:hypothetical protein